MWTIFYVSKKEGIISILKKYIPSFDIFVEQRETDNMWTIFHVSENVVCGRGSEYSLHMKYMDTVQPSLAIYPSGRIN